MSQYLEQLQDKVNEWVEKQLSKYRPRKLKGNKIIKDPVWGMTSLSPLESNIVDCPLVQRLRRIHQTGLCYLVYPSALHTRFDHSLGVLNCATKIVNAINERHESRQKGRPFSPHDIEEIRLAAILHDIGHACLSHLTEPYFDSHHLFKFSIDELGSEKSLRPKNHELISSLIVKSPAFQKMIGQCVGHGYSHNQKFDSDTLSRIADMILGYPPSGDTKAAYKSEVINGPYDADKVDYIFRDSYFTGIALSSDVERFINGLSVDVISKGTPDSSTSIVLDANAVTSYDQLIFSKVSLYANVYNHQKIMAINEMVLSILDRMNSEPSKIDIKGITMKDPLNFMNLTDWDFLVGKSNNSEITKLQNKIERRDLLLRILRISKKTVTNKNLSFTKFLENKVKLEELRKLICRGLGMGNNELESIRIGIPISPKIDEKVEAYCKHFDNDIVPMNDVFPMAWISTYATNKWVAYIYCFYDHLNDKNYETIKDIVEQEVGIKLNEKSKCKIV